MQKATLDQAAKVLALLNGAPLEQVQALLGSGLLADLRDCPNPSAVDRDEFRRVLGLAYVPPTMCLIQTSGQAHGGHEYLRDLMNLARPYGVRPGTHEFYFRHPENIPAEWKQEGKCVFFPDSASKPECGNYMVSFICWQDSKPIWSFRWAGDQVDKDDFVAVPA